MLVNKSSIYNHMTINRMNSFRRKQLLNEIYNQDNFIFEVDISNEDRIDKIQNDMTNLYNNDWIIMIFNKIDSLQIPSLTKLINISSLPNLSYLFLD